MSTTFDLLVHGYVRIECDKVNIIFPMELIPIIILFDLSLQGLAWETDAQDDAFDAATKHSAYTIKGYDILRSGGSNPFIFGKLRVNKGCAIWRFNCSASEMYWVGVVNAAKIKKETESIHHYASKWNMHTVLAQTGELYPQRSDNGVKEWDRSKYTFKTGEICVLLDMNEKTVSFSLNGGDFDIAFKDIDTENIEYAVAISMSSGAKIKMVSSVQTY